MPLRWIPTLYIAESLPYMTVMTLSVIMYTNLGLTNTQMALYTSWLYLPWVIKPLWSPLVDAFKNERWWILTMQLLVGSSMAAVAFSLQMSMWLQLSLAAFWLMAFSSATHDIAADGFYILALDEKQQALYVGWRSTFYRIGMLLGQGGLVILAGYLEQHYSVHLAWSITMLILAACMATLYCWHNAALPRIHQKESSDDNTSDSILSHLTSMRLAFVTLVQKPNLLSAILFMLLFRLPEAQLAKMAQPFMLHNTAEGGLGLPTSTIGYVYGTVGLIGLLAGGIIGGWLVSKHGLKQWWWPMVMAISLPDAVYIYLSLAQPTDLIIINSCVFIEQLGYGFGFTAYMLFLVYFSKGEHSTAIFSICTALQALGMMLPGMFAGYLADLWGYPIFFSWVMGCCLVTVVVSAFARVRE